MVLEDAAKVASDNKENLDLLARMALVAERHRKEGEKLLQSFEALDKRMSDHQEQLATLGHRPVALSSQQSEDEHFAMLEEQTKNIAEWFQHLKQLKQEKDNLRDAKNAVVAHEKDRRDAQNTIVGRT